MSERSASVVIARTDPNEQESVVLLPEFNALVDMENQVLKSAPFFVRR
jgi:hypothetical protein